MGVMRLIIVLRAGFRITVLKHVVYLCSN